MTNNAHSRVAATMILTAILGAGCAPQEPVHTNPVVVKPLPPAPPAPPPKAEEPPKPPEITERPDPCPTQRASEESHIRKFEKNYLSALTLTETLSGFKEKKGSFGMYEQDAASNDRFRLKLAPKPAAQQRMTFATYNFAVELDFSYVEHRKCKSAACGGKNEDAPRKSSRTVKLQLTPARDHTAESTLDFADPAPKGFDTSYSNIVMKVKRISLTGTECIKAATSSGR